MMKYFIYTAIAICGLLFSCTKAEKKKLVGTWNIREASVDTNNNKMLDDPEKSPCNGKYIFESNGKVTVDWGYWCMTGSTGEWEVKNDGKELVIARGGTVVKYEIQTLTNKELKIQSDNEAFNDARSWMTMEKQ